MYQRLNMRALAPENQVFAVREQAPSGFLPHPCGDGRASRMPDTVLEKPVGPLVSSAVRPLPDFRHHVGHAVTLEPLSTMHAPDIWSAAQGAEVSWTYLKYGPFETMDGLKAHVAANTRLEHQPFFAVIPSKSGRAEGWMSYCDIAPQHAAIEIGSIWFATSLQRTRAATEAVYLLLEHAFSLGYRRVVWRCNELNAASMRAAIRFGFTPEGTWRASEIIKNRSCDTAWHSMIETE
jgi:RimJ/RimL family protein N-acetyltransferase